MSESQPTQEQQPQTFTINDLNTLAQVVKLAAKRGAFEAAEMSAVGAVYDRLVNFISQQTKAETPESAVSANVETAENTETEAKGE